MSKNYAFYNGDYVPFDELRVGIHCNTLHYGAGLFEGIRCYPTEQGPAVFRLHEHTDRLFHGLRALDLELAYSPEEVNQTIIHLLQKNELDTAYIRPLVFLGDESLRVHPEGLSVNLSITTLDFSNYQSEERKARGLSLKTSSFCRQYAGAGLPTIKCNGSYVNSILAIKECIKCGFDDALMLDNQGMVAEASGANIFLVRGNKLYTPDRASILPGITRATIIELAKSLGLEVKEGRFSRDQLYMADEVFLTGTAYEVIGIRQVDHVVLGDGTPGPLTCQLKDLYLDQVHGRNVMNPAWLTHI